MREERILAEIDDIINHRHHYGQVDMEWKEIRPHVYWFGVTGYTSSIGQWLRAVDDALKKGLRVTQTYRWFCHTDLHVNKEHDSMWYYGIELEDDFITHEKKTYCCGGCTDFSGEGGHGKQLAEGYLSMISSREPLTLNADYLITMLTGEME